MSPTATSTPAGRSGIKTLRTGERHIPQSVRPDGSLRKEIKIRPGYQPPEDVEVYKNRTAEAFKTRGTTGVPGAEGLKDGDDVAAKGKNAKRREARRKAKVEAGEVEPALGDSVDNCNETPPQPSADDEREKQARNLRKRLRQAKELKEKKEAGQNLLPEQFAKVIKIQELMRQLNALGLDSDGTTRPDQGD